MGDPLVETEGGLRRSKSSFSADCFFCPPPPPFQLHLSEPLLAPSLYFRSLILSDSRPHVLLLFGHLGIKLATRHSIEYRQRRPLDSVATHYRGNDVSQYFGKHSRAVDLCGSLLPCLRAPF